MAEYTPYHNWRVPTPGADEDEWGEFLNTIVRQLDREVVRKGSLGTRPTAGAAGRWYLATDRNPPALYYDTGSQWRTVFDAQGVVLSDGSTEMTRALPINDPRAPNFRWRTAEYLGAPAGSNRFVILLCPTATGTSADQIIGSFFGARSGGSTLHADRVETIVKGSTSSAYAATLDTNRGSNQGTIQWRYVTCTYQGTEYLALDYDLRTANRGMNGGVFFTGFARSTGTEDLTLIEYSNSTASNVLNTEIYNSISAYESASSERRIVSDVISLEGRAQVNRQPTSAIDVANKSYVDTHGGGGGGGGSAATIHIDNFGADPTGNSASDAALRAAVAEANENDRIAMTDGVYRLDDRHTFTKSLTFDGSAGRVITTYNASYTEDLEACMSFRGNRTHEMQLTAPISRGDQRIPVQNPGAFSEDDGIIIREGGYLTRGYKPTRDVVERVDEQASEVLIKRGAQYDYDPARPFTAVGRIDPVIRPRFQNMTFVSGEGNIPVQTRFCRDAIYEDVSIIGYARHALCTWDDLGTRFRNCETSNPTSFDASSGEAIFIVGGTDVTISHPRIRSARRGIDIRSGCQNVIVIEPNMSDITLHGISFHNDGTNHVRGSVKVIGGTISARQTDSEMSAYQFGTGFNTSNLATYQIFIGTTFRSRFRCGNIFGRNVTCRDCHFEPVEETADLIEIHSGAENIRLLGCHWTNSEKAVTRAVHLRDGATDVTISGTVEGRFIQAVGRYDTVHNIDVDLDIEATGGAYIHYVPIAQEPTNLSIAGTITGSGATSETLLLENGRHVEVDVHCDASATATVRAMRIYNVNDLSVSGFYKAPGRGLVISGSPNGVTFDGATVESDGGTQAIGSGLLAGGAAPKNVKVLHCDVSRGSNRTIVFENAVDALWIGFNTAQTVTPHSGSNVIFNSANGLASP